MERNPKGRLRSSPSSSKKTARPHSKHLRSRITGWGALHLPPLRPVAGDPTEGRWVGVGEGDGRAWICVGWPWMMAAAAASNDDEFVNERRKRGRVGLKCVRVCRGSF
ncbi:hypothetical protein NL676_002673 [Syzygium grande]|nr:hypothetical protein NL676_002673 [Syzygium grande]